MSEGTNAEPHGRLHLSPSGRLVSHDAAGRVAVLEQAYDAERPLATLGALIGLAWWQYLGLLAVFCLKNLPVWFMPLAIAGFISVLRQPEVYGTGLGYLLSGDPARMVTDSAGVLVAVAGMMFFFQLANIPAHMWFIHHQSRIIRALERNLRAAMVRRLQQLTMAFHSQTESGRLQAKVLRDVENVEQFCQQMTQMGLQSLVTLAWAGAYTAITAPLLALFYLVAAPLSLLLVSAFRSRIRANNRAYREQVETMSSRVSEMIDMIPVTRAHGLEETEIRACDAHLDQVVARGRRLDLVNAFFQSSAWVTMQVSQLLTLCVTGWMCWHGHLTIEEVVLYQTLFALIVMSVQAFLGMYPILARGMESLRSLGEVLQCPDLERNLGKRTVDGVDGGIVFEDVVFAYPGRDEPAIRGFCLRVHPGECIAFVGESGSGKTTVMGLVIGFHRPRSGRVLLDGIDMETLDLRTWRRHLAVVSQQVLLFSGSLRDNICYGLENVDEATVWQAVEAANLGEVVRAMPAGLDTPVGENGVQLSGGQRQRIAIARALIRDPQVIILDEATSALDVVSERLVQEAIDRLVAGRTTFIVAHRLSTIRRADRVVVMRQGRAVEIGTQTELMAKDGEFARLKKLQG